MTAPSASEARSDAGERPPCLALKSGSVIGSFESTPQESNASPQIPQELQEWSVRRIPAQDEVEEEEEERHEEIAPQGVSLVERIQYRASEEKLLHKLKRKLSHAYFVPIFLILLGVCSALLGFSMDAAIALLHGARVRLAGNEPGDVFFVNSTAGVEEYAVLPRFIVWVVSACIMMAIAVATTANIGPAAAGSGIPEMKAVLGGYTLPHFLSLRTLISKVIGLVFALGSGASIGKEGPFVHTSSAIAEQLTRIPLFRRIRMNDALKGQLLAAGCAVGVASNFGAPVGGVLFSVEVTATYYMVSQYWKGFFAAISGAVMFRAIESSTTEEGTLSAMFETNFGSLPWETEELIAFVLVGIMCGLVAGIYVTLNAMVVRGRKRLLAVPLPNKDGNMKEMTGHYFLRFIKSDYTYAIFTIFVTSVLAFPYAEFRFLGLSQGQQIKGLFSNNTIGNAVLSNDSEAVGGAEFLEDWAKPDLFLNLLIFIVYKVILTAVSTTLPVPAGVFMPTFALGAGVGRFVGEIMAVIFPYGISIGGKNLIVPGGYAVVGAAAMAGGVTGTISSAVIVFELTGELDFIVPVLVAVLVSIVTRDLLAPTVFDSIAEMKGLPYMTPEHYYKRLRKLYSSDEIMQSFGISQKPESVEDLRVMGGPYLTTASTAAEAEHVLQKHDCLFYPLLDTLNDMRLLGGVQKSILQQHLEELKKGPNKCIQALRRRHAGRTVGPQDEEDGQDDALVEHRDSFFGESRPDSSPPLHFFRPNSTLKTDASPFCIDPATPLDVLRNYFTKLGLNYAFVIHEGFPVGIITKSIITNCEKERERRC